jgi:hypothetical protein
MNDKNPTFSKRQEQIIIGTILGGSSIIEPKKGKHCYLSMRDKNAKWLEHKAFQLQEFASFEPFTLEKTNRWHSCCYPYFDDLRTKFYKKSERKLDIDLLSSLWDVGMAIWFGDCAKKIENCLWLNTSVWGQKNSKLIIKYFKLIDWDSELVKERGGLRVKLDSPSTFKALQIISHELPLFVTL